MKAVLLPPGSKSWKSLHQEEQRAEEQCLPACWSPMVLAKGTIISRHFSEKCQNSCHAPPRPALLQMPSSSLHHGLTFFLNGPSVSVKWQSQLVLTNM